MVDYRAWRCHGPRTFTTPQNKETTPLSPFDSPATLIARYSPHASEKKVRSASLSSRRSTLVTYTVRATCSHSLLERGLHRRGENRGMSM